MKLLLTSNSISNSKIEQALRELVKKDLSKCSVSFIPTAANNEAVAHEDKGWLIKDMMNIYRLGFKNFFLVDLQVLTKKRIHDYLKKSDVIVVGGGDTNHLVSWIRKTGLNKLLPKILKTKVYVGISAGSMLACKEIKVSYKQIQELYYEKRSLIKNMFGLGLINIHFRPHLNSKWFPLVTEEILKKMSPKLNAPMYALDNHMALKVVGKKIVPVGEGKYLYFPK